MINVLWIAYQPLPIIENDINMEEKNATGGWLQGLSDEICKHDDINLSYCFSYPKIIEGNVGGLSYYSMFPVKDIKDKCQHDYKSADFERFKYVLEKCNPDIIQIFGTEKMFNRQFVYMARDLGLIDKTIVWIQGLTSFCSNCYFDGLTIKQIRRRTTWESFRKSNIEGIANILRVNGEGEHDVIRLLKNVFTRTEWDKACCKSINKQIKAYVCNETLRPSFYEERKWNIELVEEHSIFVSQCNTPIKGFHMVLKALPSILQEFPDCVVYTTGPNLLQKPSGFLDQIRESSYSRILREEIIKNNLSEHVVFTGKLNEREMRDRYLRTHVFVSASNIENSPNSVGEALILGLPVVASDVGGVGSMVSHGSEGFLYPFNEYALMAEYICKIFRSKDLALKLSRQSMLKGNYIYDRDNNYNTLLRCYTEMMDGRINGKV